MATTKIWAVKDSISRVINYARNPDKTTISDLKLVLLYAKDKSKTSDENLIKEYKSKISDCSLILKKYRFDLKIANQIIEDVPKIKEVIKI